MESKKSLLEELTRALAKNRTVTLSYHERPIAVVLPVEDYEKYKADREQQLQHLKKELHGILTLVRGYTRDQSLLEVERRLAALRQEIEQEMENP
jgi:hypothetical protein